MLRERDEGMFFIPNFGLKADRLHRIILQARLWDWTGGPEFTSNSSSARSYITKAEPRLARALPALQKQYGSNVNFSSFWFVPVCAVNKVTLKGWSHYYLCEWFMICTLEISNFHARKGFFFSPFFFFFSGFFFPLLFALRSCMLNFTLERGTWRGQEGGMQYLNGTYVPQHPKYLTERPLPPKQPWYVNAGANS